MLLFQNIAKTCLEDVKSQMCDHQLWVMPTALPINFKGNPWTESKDPFQPGKKWCFKTISIPRLSFFHCQFLELQGLKTFLSWHEIWKCLNLNWSHVLLNFTYIFIRFYRKLYELLDSYHNHCNWNVSSFHVQIL